MTGDNVFILPDWKAEEKSGRFHLPQIRNRELPNTGIVEAAPEFSMLKKGDRVFYDRHRQQLMEVRGQRFALVKIEHVLGIWEE